MFLKKANIYFKNVDKIVLKVEFLSEHNWNPIKIQWTAVRLPESKFNNRLWWLRGRCATDQITLHKFSVFWVISFTSLLYKKKPHHLLYNFPGKTLFKKIYLFH